MTINTNVESEGTQMDNIIIFPILKRHADGSIDTNSINKDQIDQIAYHYTRQIIHNSEHQGFTMDKTVYRDFDLVYQALKSALSRAADQYHPLQSYVDELDSKENTAE